MDRVVRKEPAERPRTERTYVNKFLDAFSCAAPQPCHGSFQSRAAVRGAATQVLPRDSPQLGVTERHQAVERLFVSISPGSDQSPDVLFPRRSCRKKFGTGDPFSRLFPEYR